MRRSAITFVAVCLSAGLAAAQDDPEGAGRQARIGMRARIAQIVLPAPERSARPLEPRSPIVVRITGVWPHGDAFRYDLEWYGLEAGQYDLAAWLEPADGLPPIPVEVVGVLPPGHVEPHPLPPTAPLAVGGYWTWVVVAGGAWALAFLAILFAGRRRRRAEDVRAAAPPRTLAERLRPMVEDALHGRLDAAGKARLERLLLAHWRRRLGLEDAKAVDAIATLRRHEEAGVLLRALEEWLHSPVQRSAVAVDELLAPYRDVPAEPDAVERSEAPVP